MESNLYSQLFGLKVINNDKEEYVSLQQVFISMKKKSMNYQEFYSKIENRLEEAMITVFNYTGIGYINFSEDNKLILCLKLNKGSFENIELAYDVYSSKIQVINKNKYNKERCEELLKECEEVLEDIYTEYFEYRDFVNKREISIKNATAPLKVEINEIGMSIKLYPTNTKKTEPVFTISKKYDSKKTYFQGKSEKILYFLKNVSSDYFEVFQVKRADLPQWCRNGNLKDRNVIPFIKNK